MRIPLFLALFVIFSVTVFSEDVNNSAVAPDLNENQVPQENGGEVPKISGENPPNENVQDQNAGTGSGALVPDENFSGAAGQVPDENALEAPEEQSPRQIADENASAETREQVSHNPAEQDTNASKTVPVPEPVFVYPLELQSLSGLEVIIVSVPGADTFEPVSVHLGETPFETIVSANTISADINTLIFPDGNYYLRAGACSAESCSSKEIRVEIKNSAGVRGEDEPETAEETLPESKEKKLELVPSNVFSALSVFDLEGSLVDSGSEKVFVEKGTFNAKLQFFGETIDSIMMDSLEVDSNALLVEVDEEIPTSLETPSDSVEWKKIMAVNPRANFVGGTLRLKVPNGSDFLYKCAEWDFAGKSCEGDWFKALDTENRSFVTVSFSPADPGFGFAAKKPGNISFGRLVECPKCGQHKVSPLTTVEMTITADASKEVVDVVLEDYFPSEWTMVLENGGTVSDVNSEFKKIYWDVGTFTGEISRSYQIFSPEKTTPPPDYYFFSSLDGISSDYWRVKVADPAVDVNLTVESCSGGTTINSCSGMNTLGSAQDLVVTKNSIANLGINNGSYTASINSVKVWLNHSGAAGITGTTGITLQNFDGSTVYCTEDTSISNTVSFTLDSMTACTPAGGWTKAKLDDLNILVKNLDVQSPTDAYYDYLTVTVNYNPNGTLSFSITNPPADSNTSVNNNTNFLVDGSTTCNDDDCGSVDTTLQYCVGAACSNFVDVNSDAGSPLLLVSGSQPQNNSSLTAGNSYAVSWVVKSTIADTYELRFRATGSTADTNTSSGTDRTITTQAAANDYSFTLSLPSSGCTEGKGSIDAGADCEKGYFETTDLSGLADETQVGPEGQSASPFFVFDNQSSTSSDFNITLDLNASLPSALKLKASNVSGGYESTCSGAPSTGCIDITTLAPSVGTAVFSAGTQDLNVFLWADFVGAGVLVEDRNVLSMGIAPE